MLVGPPSVLASNAVQARCSMCHHSGSISVGIHACHCICETLVPHVCAAEPVPFFQGGSGAHAPHANHDVRSVEVVIVRPVPGKPSTIKRNTIVTASVRPCPCLEPCRLHAPGMSHVAYRAAAPRYLHNTEAGHL
jgi:hypothetical protein